MTKRAIISLLLWGLSNFGSAQAYEPPQYPGNLTNYINKYAHLFGLLPFERNYVETYTYSVFVAKDGNVKAVNVLGKDLDVRAEIKRVLRLSGNWLPARYNTVNIDTVYSDSVFICSFLNQKNKCLQCDTGKSIIYYRVPTYIEDISTEPQGNTPNEIFDTALILFNSKKYQGVFIEYERAFKAGYQPQKNAVYMMGACKLYLNDLPNACPYFLEAARYGDEDGEKVYKEKCRKN